MIFNCISAEKVLLLIMDTDSHEGSGAIKDEKGMTQGASGRLYEKEIILRETNYISSVSPICEQTTQLHTLKLHAVQRPKNCLARI